MLAILVALFGIIFVIFFRRKYDSEDIEQKHPSENQASLTSATSKTPVTHDQETQTFPQSVFDVNQMQDFLESFYTKGDVTPQAAIFFTSVLESIAQQVTEKVITACKDRSSKEKSEAKVSLEDVVQATESDVELKALILEARNSRLEKKD